MFSGAYAQPMRRPARPYSFENVRVITAFDPASTSDLPASKSSATT